MKKMLATKNAAAPAAAVQSRARIADHAKSTADTTNSHHPILTSVVFDIALKLGGRLTIGPTPCCALCERVAVVFAGRWSATDRFARAVDTDRSTLHRRYRRAAQTGPEA